MSAMNLLQNGPHQCPPSTQHCFPFNGALQWWFRYSDKSLKGEHSLHKFTCLSPLLLLCVFIHTHIFVCMYIHTHTRIHMHICTFALFKGLEGSSRSLTTVSAEASYRSISPDSLLLVLVKNHRFHWLQMLFISH